MSSDADRDGPRIGPLRARLEQLAERSGLPTPRLELEPAGGEATLARVRGPRSQERIVVPAALLDAGPAEQTWHLAACLGWWASPVPRRRHRQTVAVLAGVVTPYLVLLIAGLYGFSSRPVTVSMFLAGALLPFLTAACLRRERRALESAGHHVLRGAGHDPASMAQLVFGGRPDPPLLRRLASTEPAPATRVRAAGGGPSGS